MFNKVNKNNNGYSMIGLVITAAIIPVLAIGGFMGYGYLSDDTEVGNTNKTVVEIQDEVYEVQTNNDDRSEKVFDELENN